MVERSSIPVNNGTPAQQPTDPTQVSRNASTFAEGNRGPPRRSRSWCAVNRCRRISSLQSTRSKWDYRFVLASKFLSSLITPVRLVSRAVLVLLWSQLAFPPRAFKDVEFDDCPDNLRDLAQAIHDAGAEDLFFQVPRVVSRGLLAILLSDEGLFFNV